MTAPHAHHPAAPSCCQTNAGPRARWLAVLGALLASTMVQASAIQSPGPGIELPMSRPPGIELPRGERATGPALGPARAPESPSTDVRLGPEAPAMPSRAAGTQAGPVRLTDPALLKELTRLRRVAEPASGFGSTTAAANAAWTLGLIELHGGAVQRSPAQAQTWFERATRLGRQPLAYAGLAWCHIEGCKGPPDPAAAQQAITRLRQQHRPRALYLEWLLNSRVQPLSVRSLDPQGVSSLDLPMRDLLERAANEGDAQARIELGMEAVTNGDMPAAMSYFRAAAPRSRAAAANVQLLQVQPSQRVQPAQGQAREAEQLLEQAQRAHRGVGAPANYVEALRFYQAAANKGSAAAKRMLALIMSRPLPDGSVNVAWMSQLAYLDPASSLPQLDTRALANTLYRDPTPLFDLLPDAWQRHLTTIQR